MLIWLGLGKTRVAAVIAKHLDKSKPKLFRGPFCSWLVAECYKNLGHPLFDKEPRKITPGRLDRCDKLVKVSGASFHGDVIAPRARFAQFAELLQEVAGAAKDIVAQHANSSNLWKDFSETSTRVTNVLGRLTN